MCLNKTVLHDNSKFSLQESFPALRSSVYLLIKAYLIKNISFSEIFILNYEGHLKRAHFLIIEFNKIFQTARNWMWAILFYKCLISLLIFTYIMSFAYVRHSSIFYHVHSFRYLIWPLLQLKDAPAKPGFLANISKQ